MSVLEGIVLKKSFWSDDQNFSGLLMRFADGDMRDHIVSHKNDHGASYERYGVLQRWSRLKISFCEIFGVVQFSTFATLSRVKRTAGLRALASEFDPDCVKTAFLPQKLHATGDDPRRHDGLRIFLLYRVRSQPRRKLGPR
jgi:hypothetical protein